MGTADSGPAKPRTRAAPKSLAELVKMAEEIRSANNDNSNPYDKKLFETTAELY